MNDFQIYWQHSINRVELFLTDFLDAYFSKHPCTSTRLCDAIRYSILNGGKRLRPILVYATGEALGALPESLDAAAAAVELIHCYSLVHDDLPAMDNDDLRRGKPTCHKAFDEATAILVGDAIQTLAFELLSDATKNKVTAIQQIAMIKTLTAASGLAGMVGGQALDIEAEGHVISLEPLKNIHYKKTGMLIQAAVQLGAIGANCNEPSTFSKLTAFATRMGLAFQVRDDILDVESSSALLGKTAGKDLQQNKATFPALLGLKEAKAYLISLHKEAIDILQSVLNYEQGLRLIQLSEFFIHRTR
jgi:geranylgeranyl pyrophosphate synthase